MSFRRIAGLLRRHLAATMVVLVLAAAVGWGLASRSRSYSESTTVVFTVPRGLADAVLSPPVRHSLVATEIMMSDTLITPAVKNTIHETGGTAPFTLTPFNLYNMQYPDYSEPYVTLTATSPQAPATQRTYAAVLRVLESRLTAIQKQAGVPRKERIHTYFAGATGLTQQRGSRVRVFAGLGVLTVVAVFSTAIFLDRRRAQ